MKAAILLLFAVAPHAGAWIETMVHLIYVYIDFVAPHAGAWIETVTLCLPQSLGESRPMRARGLKLLQDRSLCLCIVVAPHAGAWIETSGSKCNFATSNVAPHAGAWIETLAD